MRKQLKFLLEQQQRHHFYATIKKFGIERNSFKKTILLINVKLSATHQIVTDHVWVTIGKRLQQAIDTLNLKPNDVIDFWASIKIYPKKIGWDYRITNLTGMKRKNQEE